ncbi:MAG: acyl-ACP--UDP-N-acetylglucosamine O-acyltransferase [Candidatus Kapabacteria bacterium]|nr:acyl-ACP--UDP-N-acetylglucosamine O-acyltransferase [Candidatus Kapabacteria bacterium]
MSIKIHPSAIVSSKAKIGENVEIGPFCVIEDDVEIGNNSCLKSFVYLANGTRIGLDNLIYQYACIATEPQDLRFDGHPTYVVIGNNNTIRENATIHRASHSERTMIGNDNLIMAYSHIAHDCKIGNKCIISNGTQLAGHVEIEDWVTLGGLVGVHQFTKIGCHSMVGAKVYLTKDVSPYCLIGKNPAKVEGINRIGLKRRGFTGDSIHEIDSFYRFIFHSEFNITDGISEFKKSHILTPQISHIIEFIENSQRGVYR